MKSFSQFPLWLVVIGSLYKTWLILLLVFLIFVNFQNTENNGLYLGLHFMLLLNLIFPQCNIFYVGPEIFPGSWDLFRAHDKNAKFLNVLGLIKNIL